MLVEGRVDVPIFDCEIKLDCEIVVGNHFDDLRDLCAGCRREAWAHLANILVGKEKTNRTENQRNADLKTHALRDDPVLLDVAKQSIGIDGVSREAEPPARIAEANFLHAGPYTKAEFVIAAARPPFLHAVFRRWILYRFNLRMAVEHAKCDAVDPISPGTDLAARHVVEPLTERATERAE
jgi:hypothetical protein